LGCDALRKEIPYIRKKDIENAPAEYKNLPYEKLPYRYKKNRVEFLVENYADTVADRQVKLFFDGLVWCKTKEDVADRVINYLTAMPDTEARESSAERSPDEPESVSEVSECETPTEKTEKKTRKEREHLSSDVGIPISIEDRERNVLSYVEKLISLRDFDEAQKSLDEIEKYEINVKGECGAAVYGYKILANRRKTSFEDLYDFLVCLDDDLKKDKDYNLALLCANGPEKTALIELESRIEKGVAEKKRLKEEEEERKRKEDDERIERERKKREESARRRAERKAEQKRQEEAERTEREKREAAERARQQEIEKERLVRKKRGCAIFSLCDVAVFIAFICVAAVSSSLLRHWFFATAIVFADLCVAILLYILCDEVPNKYILTTQCIFFFLGLIMLMCATAETAVYGIMFMSCVFVNAVLLAIFKIGDLAICIGYAIASVFLVSVLGKFYSGAVDWCQRNCLTFFFVTYVAFFVAGLIQSVASSDEYYNYTYYLLLYNLPCMVLSFTIALYIFMISSASGVAFGNGIYMLSNKDGDIINTYAGPFLILAAIFDSIMSGVSGHNMENIPVCIVRGIYAAYDLTAAIYMLCKFI
ncbi:MAG: DUF4670 domain-containing protein, partial [Clostridia bacterium]|nr:DUF4670 domain-containing protein [Clostridia bacterium]